MDYASLPSHLDEDYRLNLARDGGRRVMFGGDAYEDDLERADGDPSECFQRDNPIDTELRFI
jgi:hypothetical protein